MPASLLFPPSLALVDDDSAFTAALCPVLRERGVLMRWFTSAEDLLVDPLAMNQDFYVLDLQLPGLCGLALLAQLRRHTEAGVLVVTAESGPGVFSQVMQEGGDMHLTKPTTADQVLLAVGRVHRRVAPQLAARRAWRLDLERRQLIAPDGALVRLSPTDCLVLECLLDAQGDTVSPQALAQRLSWDGPADPNLLHATMYRLRRRIARVVDGVAPLQAVSRQGYVFRAALTAL